MLISIFACSASSASPKCESRQQLSTGEAIVVDNFLSGEELAELQSVFTDPDEAHWGKNRHTGALKGTLTDEQSARPSPNDLFCLRDLGREFAL